MALSEITSTGAIKETLSSSSSNVSAQITTTNAQAIPNTTWTQVLFNLSGAVTWDTSGGTMGDTANSRIFIPSAGKYHVAAGWGQVSSAANVGSRIKVNGTVVRVGVVAGMAGIGSAGQISWVLNLATNDIVIVEAFQGSGGSVNLAQVATDPAAAWLQATKLA